jgi:CDP-glycerol glycerophosphotransferase (TagB/SpsB family)
VKNQALKNKEYIMKFRKKKNDKLNIKTLKVENECIRIHFEENFIKSDCTYAIIMKKDKEDSVWRRVASNIDIKNAELSFDMKDFCNEITVAERVIYKIKLEITQSGKSKKYTLTSNQIKKELRFQDKQHFNRLERVTDVFAKNKIEINKEVVPCIAFAMFDEAAEVCAISVSEENYAQQVLMGKVMKISIDGDVFRIKIKYPKTDYSFKKLLLKYRTKKESEKKEYELNIDRIKEKSKFSIIEASIGLKKIDFKSLYWDLYFVAEKNGQEVKVSIRNKTILFKLKYFSLFNNQVYKFGKNMIAFPYITLGDTISFECREMSEYDGIRFKLVERLAIVRWLCTYLFLKKQNILLVFEKYCYMAQDNGFYFFKYCMENNMEEKMGRKIYYVMDKNSPDRKALEPYSKNVLEFMSIRHVTYLLAAKLLVSTDAKIHAYASKKRGSILDRRVRKRKLVFLQHGVTAFKKVHANYGKGRRGECNLFVVTSDFEKDIVLNNFRYKENEVAVTGFARWDVLEDKSKDSREILLMPTWRGWLDEMSDEQFRESNFYRIYMNLLKGQELQETLEKNNLILNFYLHPRFKEYFDNFNIKRERINFIPFGAQPLNELLMSCRMLITDYSSVAWDVFYQSKPVIFYQFDLTEYNETNGSYIDMEKQLFGEKADEPATILQLMEEYAMSDFRLKPQYEAIREKSFKYIDKDNSKRICEQIMKKGW